MRTIQREARRRGFFGKLFKLVFYAFNAVMLIILVAYWVAMGERPPADTEAVRGARIFFGAFGTSVLLTFWCIGSIILGMLALLTRGQKILITEEIDDQSADRIR